MSIYLLIPLYSLFISFFTFFSLVWYFRLQRKACLKEISTCLSPGIDFLFLNDHTEWEIEQQIDARLEGIIIGFKKQMPMISVFLSKSKEADLKKTAKSELMKLVPEINRHFSQKTAGLTGSKQNIVFNEILEKNADLVLERLWKQAKYRLLAIVFAVGLILGVVEAILIASL